MSKNDILVNFNSLTHQNMVMLSVIAMHIIEDVLSCMYRMYIELGHAPLCVLPGCGFLWPVKETSQVKAVALSGRLLKACWMRCKQQTL